MFHVKHSGFAMNGLAMNGVREDNGQETIVALASGSTPSGIAIVRMSGPRAGANLANLAGKIPAPRRATLCRLYDAKSRHLLDTALVLWFPGPKSYTGEDLVELHVHGGPAVVEAVVESLGGCPRTRLAEPGEFTRRAFENGKMDLVAVEGLADLIEAQTERQRRLALDQAQGHLDALYEDWRAQLIEIAAHVMATIDFADEDDVPAGLDVSARAQIEALAEEVAAHLAHGTYGEIVRDGLQVAIMGPPNAGKSSLLNWLAKRDVAIVTPHAGTTRDVLEVRLNIGGYLVVVTDTAGIRESEDAIEQEGIARAVNRGQGADVILWVEDASQPQAAVLPESLDWGRVVRVINKMDLRAPDHGKTNGNKDGALAAAPGGLPTCEISLKTRTRVDDVVAHIKERLGRLQAGRPALLPARVRHRAHLATCHGALRRAIDEAGEDPELVAEELRVAADALGRLTGRIHVEDLLDVVFAQFCIGK